MPQTAYRPVRVASRQTARPNTPSPRGVVATHLAHRPTDAAALAALLRDIERQIQALPSAAASKVGRYILDRSRGQGFAWTSRRRIADDNAMSVDTVDRAIQAIADAGILAVERGGGRVSSQYVARWRDLVGAAETAPSNGGEGPHGCPPRGRTDAPPEAAWMPPENTTQIPTQNTPPTPPDAAWTGVVVAMRGDVREARSRARRHGGAPSDPVGALSQAILGAVRAPSRSAAQAVARELAAGLVAAGADAGAVILKAAQAPSTAEGRAAFTAWACDLIARHAMDAAAQQYDD